jgi:hypothetical protein
VTDLRLEQLEAEARYHRDRLALYRARVHSSKPTRRERLRELELAYRFAEDRLRHARRERAATHAPTSASEP